MQLYPYRMKKLAPLVVGLAGVFTNVSMAIAQSSEATPTTTSVRDIYDSATCSLNGQTVPCEQAANAIGGIFSAFAGIFLVIMLIAFVGFIFTLWMFIDCLRRDFKETSTKVLWALAMVFFNFPAALVYYFVVKKAAPAVAVVGGGSVQNSAPDRYPQPPVNPQQ